MVVMGGEGKHMILMGKMMLSKGLIFEWMKEMDGKC